MNLSDLEMERRIDFESVDVSNLSVEVLDSLLLNESVSVESEDSLLRFILKLDRSYRGLLRHIQIEFLSDDGLSLLDEDLKIPPESVWNCAAEQITHPPSPLLDSRIISNFPDIFAEFQRKRFSLLWRGSRDGFDVQEFHRRCDGHANTLTVILDTNGNIFGGFTPVEWESRISYCFKADDSLKSFVFTLKNPHDVPARRFALKVEQKQNAIYCHFGWSPCFGGGCDIAVSNHCNAHMHSYTRFGNSYANDTGLNDMIVFTGSQFFEVKEIEVFEITA
jgi:hypothetical protein